MFDRGAARFWVTVVSLCGIGSLAAVRLATPAAADEKLTVILLFFLVPGFVVSGLARIKRPIGVSLAVALPFLWLVISRASSDSLLLFLVPLVVGVLIMSLARKAPASRLSPTITAAAVVFAAVTLLLPMPGRSGAGTRVLLIGIDGATWEVLDPLVSAGKMPTFARLLRNSHRAKLRSLDMIFSPQIWTTVATGRAPRFHGILSFGSKKSDMRVGTIWDQMRIEGRSVGLCEWFFTWPPEPGLEGTDFIIPSGIAPDCQTYPPEYSFYRTLKELETSREKRGIRGSVSRYALAGLAAWRSGIRLSTFRRSLLELMARRLGRRNSLDATWQARRLSTALAGDLFAELLRTRSPEFAAVLFADIDRVSHKYWKYMEPELFPEVAPADVERYGNVIEDIYLETDKALGKILRSVPENVNLMLVSDHGFTGFTKDDALKHRRVRILRLADELGLEGRLLGANVGVEACVYPMACPPEEKANILEYVELMLRNAHYADTDGPLFRVERENGSLRIQAIHGPHLKEDTRVVLGEKEYPAGRFLSDPNRHPDSGIHHPDGIYLLAGPSSQLAGYADSLHVLDVAPTLAALLDLPMCPRWPGNPALEGFPRPDTRLAEYAGPERHEDSPTEIDDALMDKLRALGYLE